MPFATTTAARDEILGKLKAVIDADAALLGTYVSWEEVYPDIPRTDKDASVPAKNPAGKPWIRAGVMHIDERAASLGAVNNKRRYEHTGYLWIQLFTPKGDGGKLMDSMKDALLDPFRRAGSGTANGASFQNARGREIDVAGAWHLLNCLVDFSYDRII